MATETLERDSYETLGLPGILELDFGATSCRLFGKAFAGNTSQGQVVFSRISKTIMSFQSREMSNTNLSGKAGGGPAETLPHNPAQKQKV